MRIFFICQRVPFPPDRGDKITTYNEVSHLARNHEVHVFCIGDGVRDLDNVAGLQQFVTSITAVPVTRFSSKLRILKALFVGRPLSVAAFSDPRLHSTIRKKYMEHR